MPAFEFIMPQSPSADICASRQFKNKTTRTTKKNIRTAFSCHWNLKSQDQLAEINKRTYVNFTPMKTEKKDQCMGQIRRRRKSKMFEICKYKIKILTIFTYIFVYFIIKKESRFKN